MAEVDQKDQDRGRDDYFITNVPEGVSTQDFFQFKPGVNKQEATPTPEEEEEERFKTFLNSLEMREKSLTGVLKKMLDEDDFDGLREVWKATRQ